MKTKFLLLFVLVCNLLLAQNTAYSFKDKTFNELKEAFFENERNDNIQHSIANFFISKAKKENNQGRLARGYYYKSLLYTNNTKIIYFDSIINNTITPEDQNFPIVAYVEKGHFLESKFSFDQAIKCYLDAEKIAIKKKNETYLYHIKFAIGILKSERMGDVKEALPFFQEYYKYFRNKKEEEQFHSPYQNSLFALADAYKSLHILDSATYYNMKGYKHSKKNKSDYMNALFVLNEGANQMLKKNYRASLDSINMSLPVIKSNNDMNNTLAGYYYYGRAYEGLKNKNKAVENYIKVDSIYQIKGTITPEFVSGYLYLIQYYKNSDDKVKQLLYTNKYMKIDSVLQKNYKKLIKKLHIDYDIPHIIKDREIVIENLNNDKTNRNWVIIILVFATSVILIILFFQFHLKKKYKVQFETLIQNSKETVELNKEIILENNNEEIGIADDVIQNILKKLKEFENQKRYLHQNMTISSLAIDFETNSNYLSKIVNTYKKKSFSNYINDLRIEYVVMELQNNPTLRKYTIAAIAEEVGFSTAESFSNAFFKKNKIKPSFFIKELNSLN